MANYFTPTSPWKNYNTNAGKFLAEAYYQATGADHTGQDINGNGGGNTDKGDPVKLITDGLIIEARFFPVWGNIVLAYHKGPGVWSQYAHLDKILVRKGDVIDGGTQLGTIGRGANDRYLAHLHFEIRTKLLPADYWPSSVFKTRAEARKFIAANYVDPIAFLTKMKAITV